MEKLKNSGSELKEMEKENLKSEGTMERQEIIKT